jgi:hypothetical protein
MPPSVTQQSGKPRPVQSDSRACSRSPDRRLQEQLHSQRPAPHRLIRARRDPDLNAHLHDGIPARDLDLLGGYWGCVSRCCADNRSSYTALATAASSSKSAEYSSPPGLAGVPEVSHCRARPDGRGAEVSAYEALAHARDQGGEDCCRFRVLWRDPRSVDYGRHFDIATGGPEGCSESLTVNSDRESQRL